MRYIISCENPHRHFIQIEYIVPVGAQNLAPLQLQLPAWRPGRYTLQNFAKNVRAFAVYDEKGNVLPFDKTTKDCWQVKQEGAKQVHVKYEYYANVLDAGSTFLDETQLYVNPVNCLLYVPGREGEKCEMQAPLPPEGGCAVALPSVNSGNSILIKAKDYHELVDSPFIISSTLKHHSFKLPSAPLSLGEGQGGEALVNFHLWFQGESKPEFEKIEYHFRKFIAAQLNVFGEFPFSEYHFLFQIAPFSLYHGVEHQNSTVIALGPSYDIMKEQLYAEFLGISSHELFHAWNVKAIRPAEMQPYDYSKENYSKLGYVAEGVTTYYGDLMLFRSGAVSEYEFIRNLHLLLQKYFHNYGRFNLSVGASSFDTWLDGYEKGIPHRKVSIYNEGALCALMLDLLIRRQTGNDFSMDDVMKKLYQDFGKKGIGYTEEDYHKIIETVAGATNTVREWSGGETNFFDSFYNGKENYEPLLRETLAYVGLEIKDSRSKFYFENRFGFKAENKRSGALVITEVAPNSIADKAGLSEGDELVAVNGIKLLNNLKEWLKYFQEETVMLTVLRSSETKEVSLTPTTERYYRTYWPAKKRDATDAQKENYKKWTGRDW